ncbi:MAG TPA: dTDP-4-dehydrorhamnose reductase [Tepidisphaeraceae bacterium]|jgi:dTDP-4-dehydrorhamnose reductase|nr:dTDP-4-dehydrorhamnose reductase [Tepidisphaeraceae bacterium]
MNIYDSILITGGGGMLGHALADLLVSRGHRPVALTRNQLDIADPSALKKVFAAHNPTLVLNCAAHTKVDLCEQERKKADDINGYAVGNIASLCRSAGAGLVHVSTDFVFDGSLRRPYLVTDPVNPLSAYGKSKLLGEQELQKNAPRRWLIVRAAWVYGLHGANFPRAMVQAAQAGKPLTVVNDQFGSPTYTVDLAAAILDLLDSGASGFWHVTNSGQTTWYDFAKAALEVFNLRAEISSISSANWAQKRPTSAVRPGYSVLDLEALHRQIGRSMRPWRDALGDFHRAVEAGGF